MNVVVTGCAGFIGHSLTHELLQQQHRVFGIDSMLANYDIRIKQQRLHRLQTFAHFTYYPLDILATKPLSQCFEKMIRDHGSIDVVFHLAARAGVRVSMDHPDSFMQTNTLGTLNILNIYRDHRQMIKKLVLASTSSVYGQDAQCPVLETADTNKPLSPYAASKKAAELLCYSYHILYDLDVSIVRYFTVYGPWGRPDMCIFRFMQQMAQGNKIEIYGDGSQQRAFTYIDDIVRGTLSAQKTCGYDIYNLGSDVPIKLMEVVRHLEQLLDTQAAIVWQRRHSTDILATWANIDKAKQHLHWSAQIPWTIGLGNTVAWYKEHKDWLQHLHLLNTET